MCSCPLREPNDLLVETTTTMRRDIWPLPGDGGMLHPESATTGRAVGLSKAPKRGRSLTGSRRPFLALKTPAVVAVQEMMKGV